MQDNISQRSWYQPCYMAGDISTCSSPKDFTPEKLGDKRLILAAHVGIKSCDEGITRNYKKC